MEEVPVNSNPHGPLSAERERQLKALKAKMKRNVVPTSVPAALDPMEVRAGLRLLAKFDNGEWYAAMVTRVDHTAATVAVSVKFEDDGISRSGIPVESLRRLSS